MSNSTLQDSPSIAQLVAVLSCGMLFGAGLTLSGMISPEVVLSFLHGNDMGLMLVMGGGVMLTLLAYQLAPRLIKQPLLGGAFDTHPSTYNPRTAIGSLLFGIGWGVCGVCPGPAIASVGVGNWPVLLALIGIIAGAYLQGLFELIWPLKIGQLVKHVLH